MLTNQGINVCLNEWSLWKIWSIFLCLLYKRKWKPLQWNCSILADLALGYVKLHHFIIALLWGESKHSCRRQWAHGLLNFVQGTQVTQRQLDFSELHRTLYGKEVWKKWQLGKILHFRYRSVKLKLQRILLRILRSVCERCYDIRWSGGRGRKRLR